MFNFLVVLNFFMGTPDIYRKLHEYMNEDDVPACHALVGRLSPFGPISLLFYLFEIIYVKYFYLMGRVQKLYVLGFTIYMLFIHFGRDFLMNIDNIAEFACFPISFLSSLASYFLLKLLSFSKLHFFSCF